MKSLPLYARSAIIRAVVFIAAITSLTGFAVWREHEQALEFARNSSAATVALMEQHTLATFRVVELALAETTSALAQRDYPRHDPAMREAMGRRLKDMPYVRAIFVVGPDGFIQHDTEHSATPDVSLADREYFKAYLADPKLETSVGSPIESRSGKGWFIPVTRRVGAPGEFKGVAVAAIELRYFARLYQRMGIGQGRIVLFHRDGRMLAQYPPDEASTGRSYAQFPLFKEHLQRSPTGMYLTDQPPYNDIERLVSYRSVPGEPLVVIVSQDVDAILAPWRRIALGAAIALFVLLVTTIAAVRAYNRNAAERQRTRERMAQGEKLEAIGRLTGSVAHDFGNVLGIINNNLAILERLPQAGDERFRKAVDVSRNAVATGTKLTRDLMSFARKRELTLEEVDIGETLAQMLPILQQAGGRTAVELKRDANLMQCQVDVTQLQVALINLVVNARDAMGGAGQVTVSTFNTMRPEAKRPGLFTRARLLPWVGVTVADKGVGMDEETRRRAVEPFFTTKGEQGTGLGLAQVYGLMNQLGGEVAIISAPAHGTQVHLYFRAVESGS